MEQDREVFAIPGSIYSPLSRGCHWLIQQGAKLVETAEDIAEEILPILPAQREVDENQAGVETIVPELSKSEQVLLDAIGFDPVSLDSLLSRTGMMIDELSTNISQLELQSLIDALPGGRYSRKGGIL